MENTFYHVACSGAIMRDFFFQNHKYSSQKAQWTMGATYLASSATTWGLYSFAGNDAGFSKIVINCLMINSPFCDEKMKAARAAIDDPAMRVNVANTMNRAGGTYAKQNSPCDGPEDPHCGYLDNHPFFLLVTGYMQFFNEEEQDCNRFFAGRPLTLEFRIELNQLVRDLNTIIREEAEKLHDRWGRGGNPRAIPYMHPRRFMVCQISPLLAVEHH